MSKAYDEKTLINNNFNTITVIKEKFTGEERYKSQYKIQGELDVYEKRNSLRKEYLDNGYEQLEFGSIDFYFTKTERKFFTISDIYVMILLSKE